MMREAVSHIAQSAFFDILLNRIEGFLLGHLHFGIGPARNFDDHVEDSIALVSEERNVVERRND